MSSTTTNENGWWKRLCGEDVPARVEAAFGLAALLWQRGEVVGAEALLQETTEVPDRALAAAGMVRLARLLDWRGKSADADAMYERAAEAASAEHSPEVLLDLAARWLARGRAVDAANAYWAIQIETAEPRLRALAAYRLGDLQRDAGLADEAIASWRQSLGEAAEDLRPYVMVALAEALMRPAVEEDEAVQAVTSEPLVRPESNQEAEQMLELVLSGDHPDLAPRAALALGRLKREEGQLREAYRFFQLVIESEHPEYLLDAHAEQSKLLHLELDLFLGPIYESPAPRALLQVGPGKGGRKFARASFLADLVPVMSSARPMLLKHHGAGLVKTRIYVDSALGHWEPAVVSNHDLESLRPAPTPVQADAASPVSGWVAHMLIELNRREPEARHGESPTRAVPSDNLRRFVASTLPRTSNSLRPTFECYCDCENRRALEEIHRAPLEHSACPLLEVAAGHRVEVEVDQRVGELLLVLQGPSGVRRLARGAAVDRILWHRILDLLIFDSAGLLTKLREQAGEPEARDGHGCQVVGEGECAFAQVGSPSRGLTELCTTHSSAYGELCFPRGSLAMEPPRLLRRFGLGGPGDRDE